MPVRYLVLDIYFKFKFKISLILRPRKLQSRISSYPYLCWDTYYNLSTVRVTSKGDLVDLHLNLQNHDLNSVYLITELIDSFEAVLKTSKFRIKKLIIGESDDHNHVSRLISLLTKVDEIYANHLIGFHPRIRALPVGIERQVYRSGGQVKSFRKKLYNDPNKRNIQILVAWNNATNMNRKRHLEKIESSKKTFIIRKRVHASTFHSMLRKTLFVPCPAGNGIDTHRVWEAIYLGAVPVILESEFCGDATWPVIVVNNWSELLEKNKQELNLLFTKNSLNQKQSIDFGMGILKDIFGEINE
jgi:hypothetical protein